MRVWNQGTDRKLRLRGMMQSSLREEEAFRYLLIPFILGVLAMINQKLLETLVWHHRLQPIHLPLCRY